MEALNELVANIFRIPREGFEAVIEPLENAGAKPDA
jgi:hypothetical protein